MDSNLQCPSCEQPLRPVQLRCDACNLTVEAPFRLNEFATLASEDLHFLRIFVRCEGRIKDMEAALGLSYPTIRTRLTALKNKLQGGEPVPEPDTAQRPAAESEPEPLGAVLHQAVSRSVEAIVERAQPGGRPDTRGNTIHLSHFEPPEGPEVIFAGNQIRMSKGRELDFQRSAMTDNRFDACRMQEIHLTDSQVRGCHFTSSSLGEVTLSRSTIAQLELFSSKWGEVILKEKSRMDSVQMRSSVAKEVQLLNGTEWLESGFSSSVLAEATLRTTRWAQCRCEESKFSEVHWDRCEWIQVVTRGIGFERMQFNNCRFSDVAFTAEERCFGKRWAWSKTRFEDCQLDGVLFADCQTRNTVFRNVILKDFQVRGADLSGLTIDGNEAFLRATAAHRP